jgi:hypothetical protein
MKKMKGMKGRKEENILIGWQGRNGEMVGRGKPVFDGKRVGSEAANPCILI